MLAGLLFEDLPAQLPGSQPVQRRQGVGGTQRGVPAAPAGRTAGPGATRARGGRGVRRWRGVGVPVVGATAMCGRGPSQRGPVGPKGGSRCEPKAWAGLAEPQRSRGAAWAPRLASGHSPCRLSWAQAVPARASGHSPCRQSWAQLMGLLAAMLVKQTEGGEDNVYPLQTYDEKHYAATYEYDLVKIFLVILTLTFFWGVAVGFVLGWYAHARKATKAMGATAAVVPQAPAQSASGVERPTGPTGLGCTRGVQTDEHPQQPAEAGAAAGAETAVSSSSDRLVPKARNWLPPTERQLNFLKGLITQTGDTVPSDAWRNRRTCSDQIALLSEVRRRR